MIRRTSPATTSGLPELDLATLVLGVISLAIILGLRFAVPKVPGALVLVILGLLASAIFNLGELGIALVGEVPRGLPSLALPSLQFIIENIATIGAAAVGLLLIGFSQSAGDAREFASRHKYRVDINQESVAQGMANVGSGLVQGIPVSTSLSASSLNDSAGAKTPVASLTTGVLIILTLILLAPLFSFLPKGVLAAIIIDAVVFGMMDVKEMRRLRRVARVDFWIAIAAILGVLGAGVLAGVACGVVGSFVVVRRITSIAGAIAHCVLGGLGAARYLSVVHGWQWIQPMHGAVLRGTGSAMRFRSGISGRAAATASWSRTWWSDACSDACVAVSPMA